MCKRFLAVALACSSIASLDLYALPVDLTAGASGTLFLNQSFNETRAADVTVVGSVDLSVHSMTLSRFDVGFGSGSLGARIYDSTSGTLLASAEAPVAAGSDQSLTIPMAATLAAGHIYRVGFFLGVGGFAGDGDGIDVDPPGFPFTSYVENAGLLRLIDTFQSSTDTFPTTPNTLLPFIGLEITQVPEPTVSACLVAGILLLIVSGSRCSRVLAGRPARQESIGHAATAEGK